MPIKDTFCVLTKLFHTCLRIIVFQVTFAKENYKAGFVDLSTGFKFSPFHYQPWAAVHGSPYLNLSKPAFIFLSSLQFTQLSLRMCWKSLYNIFLVSFIVVLWPPKCKKWKEHPHINKAPRSF